MTSRERELYEAELSALEETARRFVEARARQRRRIDLAGQVARREGATEIEFVEQLLLVGMTTAGCARVYNLAPQAGFLDPRTLFTGKPE